MRNRLVIPIAFILTIPAPTYAVETRIVVSVAFAAKAINNPNLVGGDCWNRKITCEKGRALILHAPAITEVYDGLIWVKVKTNGKTVRIKMGNLYVRMSEDCYRNFEAYLAGDGCIPRRPQGSTVPLKP